MLAIPHRPKALYELTRVSEKLKESKENIKQVANQIIDNTLRGAVTRLVIAVAYIS